MSKGRGKGVRPAQEMDRKDDENAEKQQREKKDIAEKMKRKIQGGG